MPDISDSDCFEIGGEGLLAPYRAAAAQEELTAEQTDRLLANILNDIEIRIGTLLKAETVSFLLGAGASVECGGVLIGKVPLKVEQTLMARGISGGTRPRVRSWLKVFYLAVQRLIAAPSAPTTREAILQRRDVVEDALQGAGEEETQDHRLPINFEHLLALLYRWRTALPEAGGQLRLDGSPKVSAQSKDLDDCLTETTHSLAEHCTLPLAKKRAGLDTFKNLIRKLLTRPLNLKRTNIFTLNYDTLVEQAADAEGVVLLDGFVGATRRMFRPESYEQDLYFPAETTEGRVHRYDRVLHLYKLHGSITWWADEPSMDNPYGLVSDSSEGDSQLAKRLIYPTPAKYGETLGMPYSELFRRFSGTVARPQSVLFVIGYGFGDEHVNTIIRQALAVPSFTLVVVDPCPQNQVVKSLRAQRDRRVWVVAGKSIGTFSGFVGKILPDLRDEDVRKKVLATHRALANAGAPQGEDSDDH